MSWILKKLFQLFDNRFIKSASRYAIAALIGALITLATKVPWLEGNVLELANFLKLHEATLAEILAGFLTTLLALWSVLKNKANAQVQKAARVKIK